MTETLVFITNVKSPYMYDIKHILALLTGLPYRFRYREKWVDPKLQGQSDSLVGRELLLVARDVSSNRLYPLRWANITDLQIIGDIYYFEYEVAEIAKYPDAPDAMQSCLNRFNDTLSESYPRLPAKVQEGREDTGLFAFECDIGPCGVDKSEGPEDIAWARAVRAIAEVAEYEGEEFIKIAAVAAIGGESSPVKDGHLLTNGNTSYQVRVLQYTPNPGTAPVSAHEIVLSGPDEHIRPIRDRRRVVGKYDLLKFEFRTSDVRAKTKTYLTIKSAPDPDYEQRELDLPLLLKPKHNWAHVLGLLLTGLGGIVLLLWSSLMEWVGGGPRVGLEELRDVVGIIMLIVSIVGARTWTSALGGRP